MSNTSPPGTYVSLVHFGVTFGPAGPASGRSRSPPQVSTEHALHQHRNEVRIMREVDTITLGAGGGAYPDAFALAWAGRDVVMADSKGVMSGNCLAEGCVPSKAVFEVAELRRRLRLAPMGKALGTLAAPPDYLAVVAHKNGVQRIRYRQHDDELAGVADRLQLLHGTGRLVDPHTVEVTTGRL